MNSLTGGCDGCGGWSRIGGLGLAALYRWATVTMIEPDGRRHSVDLVASSVFDAAHLFVAHVKENPRNGIPRPATDSIFEVSVDGKIHRVTGKALQQWILKERQERKGPAGFIFSKRPSNISPTILRAWQ